MSKRARREYMARERWKIQNAYGYNEWDDYDLEALAVERATDPRFVQPSSCGATDPVVRSDRGLEKPAS